jgi:hypothetical protein
MRSKLSLAVVAAILVCLWPSQVLGHHAFAAEFDATQVMTLKGTITKVERINPHGWIHIDVKDANGKVASWAVETGAPNALARLGVKRDSLPIGQEVIITGYRAKDGSTTINGNKITTPDGKDFLLGSSLTGNAGGGN